MSPIERRTMIHNRLMRDGKVSLTDLAAELGVSTMTVRRDLRFFVEQGIATISSGTVHLMAGQLAPALVQTGGTPKPQEASPQRQAIGKEAALTVADGETIIIDCGSTTAQMLRFLAGKRLTIITNSLRVAELVGTDANFRLIYAPGEYSPDSRGMVGPLTVDFFHTIRADKAFLGAHGFDAQGGVNEPVQGDATAKRAMLDSTDESYLLADSAKYGNVHLMALSKLSDFSCVITDDDFPADKREELEAASNRVIYARQE